MKKARGYGVWFFLYSEDAKRTRALYRHAFIAGSWTGQVQVEIWRPDLSTEAPVDAGFDIVRHVRRKGASKEEKEDEYLMRVRIVAKKHIAFWVRGEVFALVITKPSPKRPSRLWVFRRLSRERLQQVSPLPIWAEGRRFVEPNSNQVTIDPFLGVERILPLPGREGGGTR